MKTHTNPVLPLDLGDGPFAVTTNGLSKRYGSTDALGSLDLRVPEGAVYVLVGPNGAGKTTLLRTLMGMARRDGGTVDVLGIDPAVDGAGVRSLIGYVPEHQRLGYPWMTVGRLIEQCAALIPSWDAPYADRLITALQIDTTRKCRSLSKGQSRRVQILLALSPRPRLLLLDEPTDGLDHVIRDVTLTILSEHLADSPTTALISTHRVYEIERLVDHVGVLRSGRLLGQMSVDELRGKLRRYWADVPDGFAMSSSLAERVVRTSRGLHDVEWTMWGEEERVMDGLGQDGVTVREVGSLTIDEAATALLSSKEMS